MSIPIPKDFPSDDFKRIPAPEPTLDKPNLKDFDNEANWRQSATNPSIEVNIITGKFRTKDFLITGNYPKSI